MAVRIGDRVVCVDYFCEHLTELGRGTVLLAGSDTAIVAFEPDGCFSDETEVEECELGTLTVFLDAAAEG
jgi:hypothetical protein